MTIAAQYRVDIWTTDDGLPQNSVTGLTQTADGYLWLTTNDGLVRFDGARFEVFDKSNTAELTTNRLVGAFADKSGRLWFQSEDGAVLFYEKGVFTVAMKPNEIPPVSRSPFFDDQAGGVIFYSNDQNYRFEAGKFVPLQIDGLPADAVIILADREGGLWFTGAAGIYRFQDGRVKTYELGEFGRGDVYKIAYEDREGGVWLGYSKELPASGKLLRIKDDRLQSIDFPAAGVRHFSGDAAGNLWLAVDSRGVYRMEREHLAGGAISGTFQPVAEIKGISANSSGFLCPDREGGMWVGTEKGLVRILPQTIRVFAEKDGLPGNNVYPIYQDKAGVIWAGVWPNSLVRYENGVFKSFPESKATRFTTSLFEDRSGRIWAGNIGSLYYLENNRLTEFTEQAGFQTSREFSVTAEDREGNLWFGSNNGLSRYAPDGRMTVLTQQDGLPDNYIVALLQARDGKIWVGTRGGIASIENGRVTALRAADGLASNYTRSFYEDAEGVLWIGSYDGGLTRLKNGRLTRITAADGLSSSGVFCILEDNHGWFWINSNQGIFRVSRLELNDFADGRTKFLTSILYNKQDGLLNVEGNGGRQPAGFKARDGRLWFPTAGGIAVVNPETVTINPLPPPVLIEQIRIDLRPVDNDVYQKAIAAAAAAAVTLAPGQSNLEISYTGLSFINSKEVRFRYRLEGLEPDWNEVGTRRTAYYSYLPPGEYVFRVIAANRDGVWNMDGATIKVVVLPPFYRTWGFMIICVFGILLLGFTAYRYRTGQLRRKAWQQENFARQLIDSQETERGRIAAELHDGLSQSLVIIKNRAMMSLTKPDDHDRALEQLREIAEASTCAIDEVKDIIYDLRPIQLDRLGLTGAIEEIAEKIAGSHDLELVKDIEDVDKLLPKEFENSLYRIVQESLNNIIKHAGATGFEINLRRQANQVKLIVRDDGRGFAKGSETNVSPNQKSGFGLVGMTERARLLGGTAAVESAVNAGTIVSVTIPVPLDHTDSDPQI